MKILCVTPWKNTWVEYWTKYLESRGHEVKWHISREVSPELIADDCRWCDCALSHWADKWATVLSNEKDKLLKDKKLFCILRSYEIFGSDGWANLGSIKWENIERLFMLNEAHYHPFSQKVQNVEPVFFKNGIDIDKWKLIDRKEEAMNKIAFICGINEKKGIELVVQAVSELMKINPQLRLEHIGQNQDLRRWYYLEMIMPCLKTKWYNYGYSNSHEFVQNFLRDKGWIICSSIAEGHPMNVIEAMATGCVPLIHAYPGADEQWESKYIWATFDHLKTIFTDKHDPQKVRDFIVDKYDYRKSYKPVVDVIEGAV